MDWEVDETAAEPWITFFLRYANAPDNFYTGVGVGSRMSQSDAIIVTRQGNTVSVHDAWIGGYSASSVKKQRESMVEVERSAMEDNDIVAVFSRPLSAAYPNDDLEITLDSSLYFVHKGGDFNGFRNGDIRLGRHYSNPRRVCLKDGQVASNGACGGGGGGGVYPYGGGGGHSHSHGHSHGHSHSNGESSEEGGEEDDDSDEDAGTAGSAGQQNAQPRCPVSQARVDYYCGRSDGWRWRKLFARIGCVCST